MITVSIHHDGKEIGRLKFNKLLEESNNFYSYFVVEYGVERLGQTAALGLYSRKLTGFPRLRYNALGLLRHALDALDEEELQLDEQTHPPDLAGRQYRIVPAIQAWARRLYHN